MLVSTSISHQTRKENFIKVYKRDAKITRNGNSPGHDKVYTSRGKIDSFSRKSRARLRFNAANSDRALISQFCLTYHAHVPQDGITAKRHLDVFLKWIRRHVPGLVYLWVLEFQKRGAPHYHLFLSICPDVYLQCFMASRWRQITGETEEHQRFHAHPSNWIDWNMGSGAYLCKYLAKEEQKNVPQAFKNVGRFWGCTRNMVTVQAIISESVLVAQDQQAGPQVNPETGEIKTPKTYKLLVRSLRRYQRATYRQFLKGKRLRIMCTRSGLVPNGAAVIPRLLAFYQAQVPPF